MNLKALKFTVFDANLSDTKITYGYPSLFSFHGFLKNLEIKLNKEGFKVEINEFIPFIENIVEREGLSSKGTDRLDKGIFSMPRGLIEGTLIFNILGDSEGIEKSISNHLKKMRICGGKILKTYFFNIDSRIYGFYPKIKEDFNFIETVIENSLYYGKGIVTVLRTGEKILTTLNHKNIYGYNINISTAIFARVEHETHKDFSLTKDFFNKNKLYVIKNLDEIKIKQGE